MPIFTLLLALVISGVVAGGVVAGVLMLCFRRLRSFSPYLLFVPIGGAIGAFLGLFFVLLTPFPIVPITGGVLGSILGPLGAQPGKYEQ